MAHYALGVSCVALENLRDSREYQLSLLQEYRRQRMSHPGIVVKLSKFYNKTTVMPGNVKHHMPGNK
eukprot:7135373-Pyramimonas_sp.AAC.2